MLGEITFIVEVGESQSWLSNGDCHCVKVLQGNLFLDFLLVRSLFLTQTNEKKIKQVLAD